MRQLLQAVNVGMIDFVWRVARGSVNVNVADAEAISRKVFRKFASGRITLRFHDVYRLLESIGMDLRTFIVSITHGQCDDKTSLVEDWVEGPSGYRILRSIGSGLGGAVVYLAEHQFRRTKVALKWPVNIDEWKMLKSLHVAVPHSAGMPDLVDSGTHEGLPFVAMELLGVDLARIFDRLRWHPLSLRWPAIKVLGRLVLRRLETLHGCGFVHCDVSPYNMLLGRARVKGPGTADVAPYLIDLGQARPHPGMVPQRGDQPSMEFSSIRSGDGGVPVPADDLEALGWTMVYG